MLAHIIKGKVVSITRAGSTRKIGTGKVLNVVEEGATYNPAYQARLGPETVVEEDKVRLIYTVVQREDAIESMQKHLLASTFNLFEDKVGALTNIYPAAEVSTWVLQKAEAASYNTSASNNTPFLDLLATRRGISKSALAAKVVNKSDEYVSFVGGLLGRKQALEDLITDVDVDLPELLRIESEELNTDW